MVAALDIEVRRKDNIFEDSGIADRTSQRELFEWKQQVWQKFQQYFCKRSLCISIDSQWDSTESGRCAKANFLDCPRQSPSGDDTPGEELTASTTPSTNTTNAIGQPIRKALEALESQSLDAKHSVMTDTSTFSAEIAESPSPMLAACGQGKSQKTAMPNLLGLSLPLDAVHGRRIDSRTPPDSPASCSSPPMLATMGRTSVAQEALQSENTVLRAEVEALRYDIERISQRASSETLSEHDTITYLEDKIVAMEQDHQDAASNVKNMRREVTDLKKDVEYLHSQNAKLQHLAEDLKQKLTQCEDEVERKSSLLHERDTTITNLQKDLSLLKGDCKAILEQLKQADVDIRRLKDYKQMTEVELQEMVVDKARLEEEVRLANVHADSIYAKLHMVVEAPETPGLETLAFFDSSISIAPSHSLSAELLQGDAWRSLDEGASSSGHGCDSMSSCSSRRSHDEKVFLPVVQNSGQWPDTQDEIRGITLPHVALWEPAAAPCCQANHHPFLCWLSVDCRMVLIIVTLLGNFLMMCGDIVRRFRRAPHRRHTGRSMDCPNAVSTIYAFSMHAVVYVGLFWLMAYIMRAREIEASWLAANQLTQLMVMEAQRSPAVDGLCHLLSVMKFNGASDTLIINMLALLQADYTAPG